MFKKNFSFSLLVMLVMLVMCLLVPRAGSLLHGAATGVENQAFRLATLAKVWGFLKYYHPRVATGEIDWDGVLIATIPMVKAPTDFAGFNQAVNHLIREAGGIDKKLLNPGTAAHPNEKLFKWLTNPAVFSADIMGKLKALQKKHSPTDNHYVQATPYTGNADFSNETLYSFPMYPDENMRLLALFRYWNAIRYFFPYHDDMDVNWEAALEQYIPRVMAAADAEEYHLVIKEFTVLIDDGHGTTTSPLLYKMFGNRYAPFSVRYIENQTVVTRVFPTLMTEPDQVKPGDIVVGCHGMAVEDFRRRMRKYTEASNEVTRQRNINMFVIKGKGDTAQYRLLRDGKQINVTVNMCDYITMARARRAQNALKKIWNILPGNIGYVEMGLLKPEDVDGVMAELAGTRGIIFDVRNYPRNTAIQISRYLNERSVEFARYTIPDLDYPGTFSFDTVGTAGPQDAVNPDYYRGRVVIVADEQTQSHGEWTCMILQTAPDATLIGSQTAGADGNVSRLVLPGFIYTYFSGLGVYYPDGTPTQRVGLVPDIEVHPTVEGIRLGRDELVDRAVAFIEGS